VGQDGPGALNIGGKKKTVYWKKEKRKKGLRDELRHDGRAVVVGADGPGALNIGRMGVVYWTYMRRILDVYLSDMNVYETNIERVCDVYWTYMQRVLDVYVSDMNVYQTNIGCTCRSPNKSLSLSLSLSLSFTLSSLLIQSVAFIKKMKKIENY